MLTAYVHPRLGLPKFLLFQPFFIEALVAFDQGKDTQLIVSGGLSPSTTAARMRDSIHGYRSNANDWKDQVDSRFITLFTKHDGKFVISGPDTKGEVWFRHKHRKGGTYSGLQFHEVEGHLDKHIRTKSVAQVTSATHYVDSAIKAPSCDEAIVRAFVQTKSVGGLPMPVVFPGLLDSALREELQATADVAFHFDEQRNETILM